jgi:hypothetical protein
MNFQIRAVLAASCFACLMAMSGTARAAAYSGVAFCNISTAVAGNAPTLSTLSAGEATGTECATFSATAIDFSAETSLGYNLGGFITGEGVASGVTYLPGFSAASALNNSLFVFTGTANFTNGQSFTVTHDDGTEMYVNGTDVLDDPGPTGPVSTPFTYSGPTGNFGFEFIYTECCGGDADYITTLVPVTTGGPVPEPDTLAMVGSGLLGLCEVVRRRMRG